MGGAVVLLLGRKQPEFWDGALLVAPMCKVFQYFTLFCLIFLLGNFLYENENSGSKIFNRTSIEHRYINIFYSTNKI